MKKTQLKPETTARSRRARSSATPDENNFSELDAWAKGLKLQDSHRLVAAEHREERLARSVSRPPKPDSIKAKRVMISMTPALIKAAGTYAQRTGRTLSGLIADSLMEKIKRRAS